MYRKLKVKIIKYHKNLFNVVISLNKKSIRSHYIDKIGVCFFSKEKKIIMLSLKKLSFWLNKGVQISNIVSYFFAIIFSYYLKNKKKNLVYLKNFKKYNKKIKKKVNNNKNYLNYLNSLNKKF